jgi:hypothetical protein
LQKIILPQFANFALQKLLILDGRNVPEKTAKDKNAAIQIREALIDKSEQDFVRTVCDSVQRRWKTKIKEALNEFRDGY